MKTIKQRLEAEEQDDDIVKLRDFVVQRVKRSRDKMSKHYRTWDKHDDIYQGRMPAGPEEIEAREHGEPEKMVVPMSFAQVQTYVAYSFLLLTQNQKFFEFSPTGAEDYELQQDLETVMARDLRRNTWNKLLYQLLLDQSRYSLGVVKSYWSVEKQKAPVAIPSAVDNVQGFGFQNAPGMSMQDFIKYEGNRLETVSPYNWFPDTSFPLADWKKGSFVADETQMHVSQLKDLERDGMVHGVDWIEPMDRSEWVKRRDNTRLADWNTFMKRKNRDPQDQIVCQTSMQCKLVPKKYGLGEEEYPVDFMVKVVNDDRVIAVDRTGYLHDDFVYDVLFFGPDNQSFLGNSLSDTIYQMQDVVSYLINSRLTSVRRSLEHNLIIDPSGVDMTTVESRSPWILMKKGSPRLGVDKFVRQLQYVDTTANHLQDADVMIKLMQLVTGVNENAMGQMHSGRRSATENRAANQGAVSRMKLINTVGWDDCFAGLGRKMMLNSRQGLSMESFVKVLGEAAAARYQAYHPMNPGDLVGVEDHFVFDGTLQSEKGFLAQSLQELLSAAMSNPTVMQMLQIDISKLVEEILRMRGVDDIERFKIQPTDQNVLGGLIPGLGNVVGGPENSAAGVARVPGNSVA